MATLLKAAPISQAIVDDLKSKCTSIREQGITPTLKVILVGEHPPSVIYTRNKKKFMEKIGAECEIINIPEDVSEEAFLNQIKILSEDERVNGLFVQLPLPKHLGHIDVGQLIPPSKDVDGFHAQNLYQVMAGDLGEKALLPCTPKGILTLLESEKVDFNGKAVAIIGRSLIVGKPLSLLLTNKNCTVTLCHSRTKNIKAITKNADIVVAAIGKAKFVDASFLSERKDQIIIDVGINHDSDGRLCGDVDFESVKDICSAITPVPGGVGPMTINSLGQNLITATIRQSGIKI